MRQDQTSQNKLEVLLVGSSLAILNMLLISVHRALQILETAENEPRETPESKLPGPWISNTMGDLNTCQDDKRER